jgi:suppressor for copper-sensitivity B
LGGLILNLMPCVLPVLSLKLLAVARLSGIDRRSLRLSLVITAGGVLAAFAALAVTLILLKAAGTSIGWGIQFQEPWFIAGMAVVTALFAANLWGWFAVGLPGAAYAAATHETRRPLVNASLTGMFATLLATPCSAPFCRYCSRFRAVTRPGRNRLDLCSSRLRACASLPAGRGGAASRRLPAEARQVDAST